MKNGIQLMSYVCVGKNLSLSGWKGETVSFRMPVVYKGAEAINAKPVFCDLPAGWTAKAGILRGVWYNDDPFKGKYHLAPDRVEWNGSVQLAPGDDAVFAGSVIIPSDAKPGDYVFHFDGAEISMHVADHVLPPPREWKYVMNMWHNPYSIARLTDTKLWSDAHFEAMKPFMEFTAAWGQKGIVTAISDYPWNHQCYDGYTTMIRHIKNPITNEWTFDYTIFDKWVQYNFDTGNGKGIECYSLCPWGYEVTWEDPSGHPNRLIAKPGTQEFEEYWGPFLRDFVKHLEEKGWLKITHMNFDEREPGDLKLVGEFLSRVAPEFGITAAGNQNASNFDGIEMRGFCMGMWEIDQKFLDKCHERRAKGIRTGTTYVCCAPAKPNNFFWNDPDDNFWIQVCPVAHGMCGATRWTIDSWPRDPMKDASYYLWPAGDTYFIYPDASPSIRYLEILNGVQNGEKWRIMYDELKLKKAELDALAEKYDIQKALNKNDGDFREIIAETLRLLNY